MPSAGDNLSLAKLGRAVGHSSDYTTQTSLAGNCGGANSQTAFSDFEQAATLHGCPCDVGKVWPSTIDRN